MKHQEYDAEICVLRRFVPIFDLFRETSILNSEREIRAEKWQIWLFSSNRPRFLSEKHLIFLLASEIFVILHRKLDFK